MLGHSWAYAWWFASIEQKVAFYAPRHQHTNSFRALTRSVGPEFADSGHSAAWGAVLYSWRAGQSSSVQTQPWSICSCFDNKGVASHASLFSDRKRGCWCWATQAVAWAAPGFDSTATTVAPLTESTRFAPCWPDRECWVLSRSRLFPWNLSRQAYHLHPARSDCSTLSLSLLPHWFQTFRGFRGCLTRYEGARRDYYQNCATTFATRCISFFAAFLRFESKQTCLGSVSKPYHFADWCKSWVRG